MVLSTWSPRIRPIISRSLTRKRRPTNQRKFIIMKGKIFWLKNASKRRRRRWWQGKHCLPTNAHSPLIVWTGSNLLTLQNSLIPFRTVQRGPLLILTSEHIQLQLFGLIMRRQKLWENLVAIRMWHGDVSPILSRTKSVWTTFLDTRALTLSTFSKVF